LIAMPLIGWGMLSAAAYPVRLYPGLYLTAISPLSDRLHTILWDAHFYLAFALFALILVHIAAAFFHLLCARTACSRRWSPTATEPRPATLRT
jgi:cytochrome b561